jgi:hypothetical protein
MGSDFFVVQHVFMTRLFAGARVPSGILTIFAGAGPTPRFIGVFALQQLFNLRHVNKCGHNCNMMAIAKSVSLKRKDLKSKKA